MPNLTLHRRRFFRDVSVHQRAIGITSIVVIALVVAVTVIVYLRPPGQQVLSFVTNDAAALKVGQDVRVAGVTVGNVNAINLKADTISVDAKIDKNIFVGDQTIVDIRMLTAVGGYYVTLVPQGDRPLSAPIPSSRVSVPYSIADVLQKAPRVTDEIRGDTLNANIQQVAYGLSGNPDSVGALLKGLESIASTLDRQRGQVTTTLDLAQSYLQTFNSDKVFVFDLIKKIEMVLSRYNATWSGFNETYALLGEIISRIGPIAWFYYQHKGQLRTAINTLRSGFKSMQEQMGPVIDQLTRMLNVLKGIAGRGGISRALAGVILATDVCVPIPGKVC